MNINLIKIILFLLIRVTTTVVLASYNHAECIVFSTGALDSSLLFVAFCLKSNWLMSCRNIKLKCALMEKYVKCILYCKIKKYVYSIQNLHPV